MCGCPIYSHRNSNTSTNIHCKEIKLGCSWTTNCTINKILQFHGPCNVKIISANHSKRAIIFSGICDPPATNAFDMSNMNNSLPESNDPNKPKSAADFLGANANLVNLENLVTKPAPGPSK